MKIIIVTPAKKHAINGNRTSADRWAGLLRQLGHDVFVEVEYCGQSADLMIALHARHSAKSIKQFYAIQPSLPLVVALGGTDVNIFLKSEPEVTLDAMRKADALVCLHSLIYKRLPEFLHKKLNVIYQSALPLKVERVPRSGRFDVCVVGNLRHVKDPFRTAHASGHLPASSCIQVSHFGLAPDDKWSAEAHRLETQYSRYKWKGQVEHARIREEYSRTRLMVISSLEEGGANVVSEALVAGVPVIASEIEGNVGLLGSDYEGYFIAGDETDLAKRLVLAETDPDYYRNLEQHCQRLAPRFTPEIERQSWNNLIESLEPGSGH